jgi:hypothetical protein
VSWCRVGVLLFRTVIWEIQRSVIVLNSTDVLDSGCCSAIQVKLVVGGQFQLVEVVALVHYHMSIRNPSEVGIVYILRSTL